MTSVRIEALKAPSYAEWDAIGHSVDDHLLATLASLTPEEWLKPTDCDPWAVRDIVAHIVAWDNAIIRPARFARESVRGFRARKDHGGNPLDAQNQQQVDDLARVPPDELLARLRSLTPKFHKAKKRLSGIGRAVPYKEHFSGTWVTLGYALTTILGRDHFMHHIDICKATGRPFEPNPAEVRIVHDAVREWAGKAGADVTLELSGPAGGTFVRGSGETTIATDAIEFCRVISGRLCDDIKVVGDEPTAQRWLAQRAVF